MNLALRLFILSLICMITLNACKGQAGDSYAEAQALRKQMDEWMKPFRRERMAEFEQWTDWVENHVDDIWEHPVYKHMDTFFQQHRDQYLRLRKADLQRYGKAPALPGYERIEDFYGAYEDKSFPMEKVLTMAQRVGNFRILSVADSRFVNEVLSGFILDYLKAEKQLTVEQVMNKRIFGERIFADPEKAGQWQITIVNRLYAVRYSWNIADNHLSKPALWVYNGKRQSAGWLSKRFPVSRTDLEQLDRDLAAFRWGLYDEQDSAVVTGGKIDRQLTDKMTAYYRAHRKAYIQLRREELAKFPQLDAAYAKAFNREAPELKEDLLRVLEKHQDQYKIPDLIAPYETCGSYIVHNFHYMLMLHLKNYAEYALMSWIAGEDVYTRRVAKNVWEIQFFYSKYTVRFQWNIMTDAISELTIKTKQND